MQPTEPHTPKRAAFESLVSWTKWAVLWEAIWPQLSWLLTLGALFLFLSFIGVWIEAPRFVRMFGASVFIALAFTLIYKIIRLRFAPRHVLLRRLDQNSGQLHRPATTLEDHVVTQGDAASDILWRIHTERLSAQLDFKRVVPAPGQAKRDPFALRALALLLMIASAFVAGPERLARVLAVLDWKTQSALGQEARLDIWIDPPRYTGRPPIVINLKALKDYGIYAVQAPVNSTLIVRAFESGDLAIETSGGLVEKIDQTNAPSKTAANTNAKDRKSVV